MDTNIRKLERLAATGDTQAYGRLLAARARLEKRDEQAPISAEGLARWDEIPNTICYGDGYLDSDICDDPYCLEHPLQECPGCKECLAPYIWNYGDHEPNHYVASKVNGPTETLKGFRAMTTLLGFTPVLVNTDKVWYTLLDELDKNVGNPAMHTPYLNKVYWGW